MAVGPNHQKLENFLAQGTGLTDYGPPITRAYGRCKVRPRVVYMQAAPAAPDYPNSGTILNDATAFAKRFTVPIVLEICQAGATIVGAFKDKESSSAATQVTETTSATSYTVAHASDFSRDLGVTSGGTTLIQVNGAPWVGAYYCPTPGTYQFAAGQGSCTIKYEYTTWSSSAALKAIRRMVGVASTTSGGVRTPTNYQVIQGAGAPTFGFKYDGSTLEDSYLTITGDTAWSFLAGTNAAGMGFTGSCHIRAEHLAMQESLLVPALAFLVDGFGGRNASPVDVIRDILVNLVGIPTGQVITSVGSDGTAASSCANYIASMPQFVINRAIDSRQDVPSLLDALLQAVNCELVYVGGAVKILPLGDTAIGTYVPAGVAASINLLNEGTAELLQVEITDAKDVYSAQPVTFADVLKDGEQGQGMYSDDAYANLHGGRRIAPTVSNDWVSTAQHANLLAQILVRQSTLRRRKFTFTVSKKWSALECGDVVSVSDGLQLNNQLCRISLIEEQENGSFAIEAWEWRQGNAHPIVVPAQVHEGVRPLVNIAPIDAASALAASASTDAGTAIAALPGKAATDLSNANPPTTFPVGNYNFQLQLTGLILGSFSQPLVTALATCGNWVAMDDGGLMVISARTGGIYLNGVSQSLINLTVYGDAVFQANANVFVVVSNGSGGISSWTLAGVGTNRTSTGHLAIAYNAYLGQSVMLQDSVTVTANARYTNDGTTLNTMTLAVSGIWQGICSLEANGFLCVGNNASNNVVGCYGSGSSWTAINLPNNTGGTVTGARTSTAQACQGVVCGMVGGKILIITQNYIWTADAASNLNLAASWTRTANAMGAYPLKAKQTTSVLYVLYQGAIRMTLDGVNWRGCFPSGYGSYSGAGTPIPVAIGVRRYTYGAYSTQGICVMGVVGAAGSILATPIANEALD